MSVIQVTDLKKNYGEGDVLTKVLHGISFTIEKGEFVAIMGPSGSGKSTLLHILGFLDEPTSGTYLFQGKPFSEYSKESVAQLRNQDMGFVFQAFNLLPRISVLENVKLPLQYSTVPEKEWEHRALEAIDSVGLSHRLTHDPSELSGGEKQRVAIARALVNHPAIIFADEPTGNLDSKSGQAVMDILQKLNEEKGHTIILITHETHTAEHAGRIIRLLDGNIQSDERVINRKQARDSFIK